MNQLLIKYSTQIKKITIPKTNSVDDLSHIIESIFKMKQKTIGVIDEHGKFYDLQFINENLKMFKTQQLELVTVKDTNQDNMSFASENMDYFQQKKYEDLTHQSQLIQKSIPGFLGYVNDLQIFEELLLEDEKVILVICSNKDQASLKIPYNFYILEDKNQESIIIYYDHKKIGKLFIEAWEDIENKIDTIVKNWNIYEKNTKNQNFQGKSKQRMEESFEDLSNKSFNMENEMAIQEIKSTFLENIAKLRDQQTISELQYYKLKAKLYENPEDFMRKYQMGTRQSFRKKKSINELRQQIIRSKQQKSRYQTIINEFRDVRVPSREENYNRNLKNQIPIIVRKYNNVIQKISTSYPLNLQQQQALNLIMQLELKGLISQNDSRDYKSQILQQQSEIFQLFAEYFNDSIDQIELAHKLKNKKKNDKKTQQQGRRSQQIVRMIIKYGKRNSFEMLRNLAIEGNHYILECYDQYQKDKNTNVFANSLEKIANYYHAKSKLQEDL